VKILALDTSTTALGVALLEDEQLVVESITNLKINHSIKLMPTVGEVFATAGWQPTDIDLVVVAKGPGSYTGLRVGVTTAKTFAWTLGIPVVAVSTLETMAYPLRHYEGAIVPIIDARRGEVYSGLFSGSRVDVCNGDNVAGGVDFRGKFSVDLLVELAPERIMPLVDWLAEIKQIILAGPNERKRTLVVGEGIAKHLPLLEVTEFVDLAAADFAFPRPGVLGLIGYLRFLRGEPADLHSLTPTYLQLAYAEKLKKVGKASD
jgi:tRNA threonylcarbamoyladenosine biosynthesis protein TsaB